LEIRVDGNDIEKAIRLLKRKIQRDGIFRELKNKRFYEKPSLKKKRKRREAQKRKQKSLRMSRQGRSSPAGGPRRS
jgi:small subunit ribosomal protein S21